MTAQTIAPAPAPAPEQAVPKKSWIAGARDTVRQSPWVVLALVIAGAIALPVVPLQWQAFENGADGFRRLLAMPDLGDILLTTAWLGLGALVVAMVLGTTLALCVQAVTPRARKYLSSLPVLPLIIPSVAHVIGFVFLFSPEVGYVNIFLRSLPFMGGSTEGPFNVYTSLGIVLYTGLNLATFVYLFVFAGLRNLGNGYILAARTSGAGTVRTLFTVTLPLLRPSLIYGATVCLLLALGQFTGPLILGRRENVVVLTTRMFEMTLRYPVDYPLIAALGSPLIIMGFVLVVVSRRLLNKQDRFVGKADNFDSRSDQRWVRVLAATIVLVFAFLSAALPLLALLFVSVSQYWGAPLDPASLVFTNFAAVMSNQGFVSSIWTSLIVSSLAVIIVIPIGMLIAYGIFNRDKLWAPLPPILDVLANIPLTLPAALLGFGYLFAFTSPQLQLYGTYASFIIAYLTIMIPYSVRYQLATLVALGRQGIEASRANGAGAMRTFFRVLLPSAKNGIAASAAIMFILLIQEFGVSVLLRTSRASVMSVELFQQYDIGSFTQVAVMSLIMTLITSIGVGVAMMFGGTKAFIR